jgi:anti-anti-sigma regulatory factor
MPPNPIPYQFEGQIRTDFTGFRQLFKFYHEIKKHYQKDVLLDFSELDWFDANLAAVLHAIMHELKEQNQITFWSDVRVIEQRFEVLLRNGFIKFEGYTIVDDRQSTVTYESFCQDQKYEFKEYIENKLMCHRAMPKFEKNVSNRIKSDLIEIFNNYCQHSCTQKPLFLCGQYYPRDKTLIFTIIDLGVGFLPPIKEFSNSEIQTDIDAIRWALAGKSTKADPDEPSGCGLNSIHDYCLKTNSNFQIVSGSAFWGIDLENTIFRGHRGVDHTFIGSTINLFFNCS